MLALRIAVVLQGLTCLTVVGCAVMGMLDPRGFSVANSVTWTFPVVGIAAIVFWWWTFRAMRDAERPASRVTRSRAAFAAACLGLGTIATLVWMAMFSRATGLGDALALLGLGAFVWLALPEALFLGGVVALARRR